MVKKLYACLAVTALLSVGYVGMTRANLIQGHRSSTGSTQPTPPAGAQAAGFTTLVLNLDFTGATTSSFMGNTIDPTNICGSSSSWLSSPEESTNPTTPAFWSTSFNGVAPCAGHVSMFNDGGTKVLDVQYAQNDGANYNSGAMTLQGADSGEQSNWLLPIGAWYEIEYRQTPNATNSCPFSNGFACFQTDWWTWYSSGDSELDFIEIQNNAYGTCHSSSSPGCDAYADWSDPASNIINSYHTYSSRITTDGTNASVCGFLDGTLNDCNRGNSPWAIASGTLNSRRYPIITVGPQAYGGNGCPVGQYGPDNGSCSTPTANIDMYIQHIRIWTCSTWQTTPCTGAILTD